MPREKKHLWAGQPPKNPSEKVSARFVRCPTTIRVKDVVGEAAAQMGIKETDFVRLCLYQQLAKMELLDDILRADPTWDKLRESGHV